MRELDDSELLEQYVEQASEEAFAVLVERHINKIYSVALRYVSDQNRAEEITQAVFVILAQKSPRLLKHTCLSAWLYQTARLTSVTFLRSEIRRTRREQEAYMQSSLDQTDSETWRQIGPLLDDAVANLRAKDREALVLHFFDGKSMREVGGALALNESAAKKRVNRAVEKLRIYFAKRGVNSTTAVITGIISAHSVQAAPFVLTKSVTAIAVAKGTTASVSTLTLIKGALNVMAWTKTQTAIVVGAVAVLATGTATVAVKEIAAHRPAPWQKNYDLSVLSSLPPQVKILPSLPSTVQSHLHVIGGRDSKVLALGQSVPDLLMLAYGVHPAQLIWTVPVPDGKYDFVATYPQLGQNIKAGQDEIKRMFGLTGRHEMIETNVLILSVKSPNATGLYSTAGQFSGNESPDSFSAHNQGINVLIDYLERNLDTVIIDQTRLAGNFDIDFEWDKTPDGLKQVLLDELGLVLTPSRQTVDVVIVEKAN